MTDRPIHAGVYRREGIVRTLCSLAPTNLVVQKNGVLNATKSPGRVTCKMCLRTHEWNRWKVL